MYVTAPFELAPDRIGVTETIPRVTPLLFGPSAPFFVVTDQFGSAERTTKMVLLTLLLLAQNGQVPEVREAIDVKSMSAGPLVHASGSLAGS